MNARILLKTLKDNGVTLTRKKTVCTLTPRPES
jgi:hypothetical protein